jgi:biopolymer transport protein ExbD
VGKFIGKTRKRGNDENMTLNITSMMDMFTIILIFLLKSYSVNTINITPNDNLRLPTSIHDKAPEEGLDMAILKTKMVLNKKDIIDLDDGIISKKHLGQDGRTIVALAEALGVEKQKTAYIAKRNKDYKFKGTIIIQADKDLPFDTLKKVLFTTGMSGYADFRFAVVNDE